MAGDRGLWQDTVMPKDRKKTYSDRQSQAARAKKQQQSKKKAAREDALQIAHRTMPQATEGK